MSIKKINRLQDMLSKIDDPDIKNIIDGVFKVEISFRSADKAYFPRKKLMDVIEGVARVIETKEEPN